MPDVRSIEDARRAQADEVRRTKEIASAQAMKLGFTRTPAFTPRARTQVPYKPEGERPVPLEPSPPLVVDPNVKPKTARRSFGVGEGDQ